MFTLFLLAIAVLIVFTLQQDSFSQMNRMSLAFGVAAKPYGPKTQAPKPKGGKGKDKLQHLMARAKYAGNGVVALSGKIAGTVFLSNNVVRVWRKPNNVRNSFTQLVRGIFSGTSTAWKGLTPTEIASWIAAAPLYFSKKVFGTAYALKGNTLFQRVNNVLDSIGIAGRTTAPGVATPSFVITAAVGAASVGGASFGVTITDFFGATTLPPDSHIKAYGTRQVDIGKSSFSPSAYRLFGTFAPAASTNPLDIFADYTARFGALAVGQRIGLALEVVTSDFTVAPGVFGLSGKFFLEVIVAA